ncbi:MAG TPA: hypothetical protein P5511_03930 [Candidatus Goldiibacteriota bacterium]|nr:hypothetical protein [Candidatus Goldiibacteriota bacterium]
MKRGPDIIKVMKKTGLAAIFIMFCAIVNAATFNNTTITVEAAGNTSLPVIITGETLIYDNSTNEIYGRGGVVARHDDAIFMAENIYINPDTGDLSAEGNVMAAFKNARVYSAKLYYNTKTQEAYCEDSDVISPPWIIKGKKFRKSGERIDLETPVFTTCDFVHPHYRMEAASITIYGSKKIEAWHIAVYLGMMPVMYFPYFAQSLENEKDPFDFKFGHNDVSGLYASIYYSFFIDVLETVRTHGQLGFSWYEKKGPSYSLSVDYTSPVNSSGSFAGSYIEEKDTMKKRWSVNFNHNQEITENVRAGARIKKASDSRLDADLFDGTGVDMFTHEYGASFSATLAGKHSISADIVNVDTLDPAANSYYPSLRQLPVFRYSMISSQIIPYLYYGHNFMFNRSYTYVKDNPADSHYTDTGSYSPILNLSLPRLAFFALSGSAGLNMDWSKNREEDEGWGEFLNRMNTSANLQADILPGGTLKSSVNYRYVKKLNKKQ